eukprot:1864275-Amphidinium_carterae.1
MSKTTAISDFGGGFAETKKASNLCKSDSGRVGFAFSSRSETYSSPQSDEGLDGPARSGPRLIAVLLASYARRCHPNTFRCRLAKPRTWNTKSLAILGKV